MFLVITPRNGAYLVMPTETIASNLATSLDESGLLACLFKLVPHKALARQANLSENVSGDL